jgi:NitT/TauT family transport system permease protein
MTEVGSAPKHHPPEALPNLAGLLAKFKADHLIYLASIIGMIVLWHVVASNFFKPQFFPGPLLVLATGEEMLASGELFEHIGISLQRILTGFLIGSAIAAPAGLVMGSVHFVRLIFDPYAQFFRFVPSLAWLTPVVLWFGIGETSKILIIVYTTMFIVLINTMVGVAHIAPNKLRAAACLGATPFKSFLHVTLPATLFGYLIFNSRLWMATDKIFIGIVCLGALGLVTDRFFRYLVMRFAHQYGPIE